jgi:hypothetical protein
MKILMMKLINCASHLSAPKTNGNMQLPLSKGFSYLRHHELSIRIHQQMRLIGVHPGIGCRIIVESAVPISNLATMTPTQAEPGQDSASILMFNN